MPGELKCSLLHSFICCTIVDSKPIIVRQKVAAVCISAEQRPIEISCDILVSLYVGQEIAEVRWSIDEDYAHHDGDPEDKEERQVPFLELKGLVYRRRFVWFIQINVLFALSLLCCKKARQSNQVVLLEPFSGQKEADYRKS